MLAYRRGAVKERLLYKFVDLSKKAFTRRREMENGGRCFFVLAFLLRPGRKNGKLETEDGYIEIYQILKGV